ncbi:uncharacterized protein LOC110718953 [Chenopodium quinoa]|uniref:uncharacterized protein LOC110718953 n=1 Tax=Chenopodium quinoa TaxID=63459 RepID=UPI000B79614E|nr:uncharacterized protein LOC110718953 [Chenopodium quinoa]
MAMDPSQNPTSPFYLLPSDNPCQKLVNFKFDGNSTGDWKPSMLISLSAKNKLGFVDGSLIKPAVTSDLYLAWERCNNMIISWLLGVLEQDIARSVLYFSTTREIWLNLEERYGQSSCALLYSLQQALHEIKQDQDNILGFYTKIKMI